MAIRSAKLNLLQVAYPTLPETEVFRNLLQLAQSLTQDFLKEGFLFKTGPKPSDGFKRRWFTLDGRKLMYHEQKLVQRNFLKNATVVLTNLFPAGSLS